MFFKRPKDEVMFKTRMFAPQPAGQDASQARLTPQRGTEQPHENLVTDPVLNQAMAEERFFAEQIASGYQVMQSQRIDFASDTTNLSLFQTHGHLFGMPDLSEQQEAVEPASPGMEPPEPPEPEPAPEMDPFNMFLGGW